MVTKEGYIVPDGYSSDIGVFTYVDNEIKILLLKRRGNVEKDKYALPGGFVDYELKETAYIAAIRELKEETNLSISSLFIRHVGVFDKVGRDPRGWIISNAFYCVMDHKTVIKSMKNNSESYELKLFSINELDTIDLAFDHDEIIDKLVENLRADIYNNIFLDGYFKNNYVLKILGDDIFINDVHNLVKFAGLNIDKSTIYRKISKNSFFKENKVVKVKGVKKPVKCYNYISQE